MAKVDISVVVDALMARNGVLSSLLRSRSHRVEAEGSGGIRVQHSCFIIPAWSTDQRGPSAPTRRLLTVQAHTSRDDPSRLESIDMILGLLDVVLTSADARRSVTARLQRTSAAILRKDLDTIFKVGTWEVSSATIRCTPKPRLTPVLAWPDYTSVVGTALLPAGTAALN